MRLRLHDRPADANQIYPYDGSRKQNAAPRDGRSRSRDCGLGNRPHPGRTRRAGDRVRAESAPVWKNRGRPAAMARQAAQGRVRGNQPAPRPSEHRIRAADADGPRARFRTIAHRMGTQRNRVDPWRVEGSSVSGRRRRPIHRSRPRLSEQAHLLVQSLPGKNLRRPALRSDSRRDRRGRRTRVHRRGQSAANRDDAGCAQGSRRREPTCSRSSARESSRC